MRASSRCLGACLRTSLGVPPWHAPSLWSSHRALCRLQTVSLSSSAERGSPSAVPLRCPRKDPPIISQARCFSSVEPPRPSARTATSTASSDGSSSSCSVSTRSPQGATAAPSSSSATRAPPPAAKPVALPDRTPRVPMGTILRAVVRHLWPKGEPELRLRVVGALVVIVVAKLFNVAVPVLFK
eukprot:RCo008704